ncbi:MAG: polyhydroxyalkanoate synthesis repressor PhaR [Rhizobiales bacterium]|nr:polyhydroxyalkanoate synthesis repressor PhaR [Hyphomicrobiales bacterium]
MTTENAPGEPIKIKKYANRRLYNTATSSYVTLEDLAQMVKQGTDFVVNDAKSGEDITHSVLTQIIFEQETKGINLLPISFLRQMICFYGDSMESLVPSFLEASVKQFANEQDRLRDQMTKALGAPYELVDEQVRRNMAMFSDAVSMFTPSKPDETGGADEENDSKDEISDLKDQLSAIQEQLNKMTRKGS